MSHTDLWFISRASGAVSMVAMTVVFVLGMATASRMAGQVRNRALVMGLHRSMALGMTIFLLLHIVTAISSGYVNITWLSVVIPFTAGYETLWVGLGTVALDVLIAVIGTSLLRNRLSRKAWRAVHLLTYALWPMAIAHGAGMSSADQPILLWTTVACAAAGLAAIAMRLLRTSPDAQRRVLVNAQEWS